MVFLLLAFLALVAQVISENVPLTILSAENAKCLDGTSAGYYYQSSSNVADAKKWVIFLNGGGECDNENGCKKQVDTSLGSSKYFPVESNANGWFAGSDDCNINPKFCSWNHVFNPYCSQDLHSGQMKAPSNETWGLQFSGHHIISAILDDMDSKGLSSAEEIVVSGASAGGLGVWMNVDYIAERYPRARVTGLSIAGFYYFSTFYTGPGARQWDEQGTMADFRESAWPATYKLYDAFVDTDCAQREASAPGCMVANVSFPYIQTPVFVVQSLSDKVVLQYHDMLPDVSAERRILREQEVFLHQWQVNMTAAISPAGPRKVSGIFAAACWIHTEFNHAQPIVNGLNYLQAFEKFYTGDGDHVSIDECGDGILCNPTCE
eukprot:GSChrysophyteH1.ASY1.ANO1.2770.1 assembled CDS